MSRTHSAYDKPQENIYTVKIIGGSIKKLIHMKTHLNVEILDILSKVNSVGEASKFILNHETN